MVSAFSGCELFDLGFKIETVGNLELTAKQIAAMHRQGDGVKRVALCVGIYRDSIYGYCKGADLDAERDAELFRQIGFDSVSKILNGDATRANIVAVGTELCAGLTSNDLFVVSLSSHGGQMKDYSGDEPSGFDQYFCAADGPVLDDDIWRLLCALPLCRVIFKMDACHSGSMLRAPHNYATAVQNRIRNAKLATETFDGSLLYIAGCADSTYSYGDSRHGGKLSYTMHITISKSSSYDRWCTLILAEMPANQVPVITKVGGPDFGNQPLFH